METERTQKSLRSSQGAYDVRNDLFNVSAEWKPPTPGRSMAVPSSPSDSLGYRFRATTDSFRKKEEKAKKKR